MRNRTSLGGRVVRLALVLAALLVMVAACGHFHLVVGYSEGERAGVLQKFSRKGWLCKTYEGELALYVVGGVAPQIWYFSVRDERIAGSYTKPWGSTCGCTTLNIAASPPVASATHPTLLRASPSFPPRHDRETWLRRRRKPHRAAEE